MVGRVGYAPTTPAMSMQYSTIELTAPLIKLYFYSNLPGVQLYTSQGLRYKNKLAPYQGVCLETQHYPDAPNNKNFPSTLIKPKKLYKCFTKINIS